MSATSIGRKSTHRHISSSKAHGGNPPSSSSQRRPGECHHPPIALKDRRRKDSSRWQCAPTLQSQRGDSICKASIHSLNRERIVPAHEQVVPFEKRLHEFGWFVFQQPAMQCTASKSLKECRRDVILTHCESAQRPIQQRLTEITSC